MVKFEKSKNKKCYKCCENVALRERRFCFCPVCEQYVCSKCAYIITEQEENSYHKKTVARLCKEHFNLKCMPEREKWDMEIRDGR